MFSGKARGLCGVVGAFLVGSTASALAVPLGVDETAYKSHASVLETPAYTTSVPAYLTLANLAAPLMINPIVNTGQGVFTGSVASGVYHNPSGGLTFTYQFVMDVDNTRAMDRASIDANWTGTSFLDAGAGASGVSGALDGASEWLDGDPYMISINSPNSSPSFQWRLANIGTLIGPGNYSSLIWLETDATSFATTNVGMIGPNSATAVAVVYAVPEPATCLLLMLGSSALLIRRKR